MIWDSRDSCQNLESQDSQPERAGKFPEIDERLARNGCECTAPSIGLCPGARRHVKDTSWSWPYGSWSLSAHSALHSALGFSLSSGEGNCFRLNRLIFTLDSPSCCIMKWGISSGLLVEGGGEKGGAWAINMAQFKCQALQFTSDLRFMGNVMEKSFSTPLSLVV